MTQATLTSELDIQLLEKITRWVSFLECKAMQPATM